MEEVIKKLRFKDPGVILNAPENIEAGFTRFGFSTSFEKKKKSANTLIFVRNNKELISALKRDLEHIENDSVLWFAYPKGTSGIQTDINRDTIAATGETFGIRTVSAVAIDSTWSALRFRPADKVGK